MSYYYLISIATNHYIISDAFITLNDAIIKARQLTKESPLTKIAIVKTIAIIEFNGISTGEHEEIFFN
jgi:hypothetical protein